MKKQISIGKTLLICIICVAITFVATLSISTVVSKSNREGASTLVNKLAELEKLVDQNFVGTVDDNELSDFIMSAYIAGLNDKYSRYLSVDQMNEYIASLNSELVGIGVTVVYNEEPEGIYVITVMDGSPAQTAGIKPGDIITSVQGTTVTSENYDSVVNSVKGKEGDKRTVSLLCGPYYTSSKELELTLKKVIQPTVNYEFHDNATAYIEITSFNSPTPQEFRSALEQAAKDGAKQYIFDVRSNPGGSLDAIVSVLDMLLGKGVIVTITDADGNTVKQYDSAESKLVDAPMAVLINSSTASAAELFCAALRDYDAAVLVGTTSYGKGTMQTILRLSDGSGVSLSTNRYNPPCGVNYEGVGVTPHVISELTQEQQEHFYQLTYDDDPQIQAALNALK